MDGVESVEASLDESVRNCATGQDYHPLFISTAPSTITEHKPPTKRCSELTKARCQSHGDVSVSMLITGALSLGRVGLLTLWRSRSPFPTARHHHGVPARVPMASSQADTNMFLPALGVSFPTARSHFLFTERPNQCLALERSRPILTCSLQAVLVLNPGSGLVN